MPLPLSRSLLALRLIVALLLPDEALAGPPGQPPARLQSGAGDVVDMLEAARPDCTSLACPPRICLDNPAANGSAKGLSNRRSPPPDLLVAPGASACQLLAAVRQTLVLWRMDATTGRMVPALLAPLDLRNKSGRIIFLRWSVEGSTGPAAPPPPRPAAPLPGPPRQEEP